MDFANSESENVLSENQSLNIVLNASDLDILDSTIIENICEITGEDDQKLYSLLQQFNLEELFNNLKASKVTYRSLPFLSAEDIYRAIPHLGLQAEFREKLFVWRKKEYKQDASTLSVNTKVNSWLEKTSINSSDTKESSN